MIKKNQITEATAYDTKRMIFSEPISGSIPDSKPPITYRRINIESDNLDGTKSDLIFQTEICHSYGIGEQTNQDTGKVNGFSMPLVLFDRTGPTQKQKDFVETFTNCVNACQNHILENKDELELYEVDSSDFKKFNPLYYKKDKGKIVEGASPTLYGKLIVSKKNGNQIVTVFFDKESGDKINALDLLAKACSVRAAVKFESIFLGNKISLQVKLLECEVTLIETGWKRLLPRPEAQSRISETESAPSRQVPLSLPKTSSQSVDEDDDAGSLVGADANDDDAEEPPVEETIKTIPKKIVKKIVKKAVKA